METQQVIKNLIQKNLPSTDYKIYHFGSRVWGSNHKYSDYDLGILGPKKLSLQTLAKIETDLHDSDIPYQVDVVDLRVTSSKFNQIALKNAQPWI